MVMVIASNLTAQITNPNWMVGGSGSFYSAHLKDNNNSISSIGLELRPNIGYFLMDNFAVGLTPLFAYSKIRNGSSATNYGIGPYIRYYFLRPEKRVNVLSQIGFTYSGNDSSSLNFKAGPALFLNNSVALEMTLNYNLDKLNSTTNYNILSLGIGLQIHLEKY